MWSADEFLEKLRSRLTSANPVLPTLPIICESLEPRRLLCSPAESPDSDPPCVIPLGQLECPDGNGGVYPPGPGDPTQSDPPPPPPPPPVDPTPQPPPPDPEPDPEPEPDQWHVNLVAMGMNEHDEECPGGFMPVNNDFDENNKNILGNRVPDNESDSVFGPRIRANDNELRTATLYITAPSEVTQATWSIGIAGVPKIKLWMWKDAPINKWVDIYSGITETSAMPLTRSFIIEGIKHSTELRDVTIGASAGGEYDLVKLTLPEVDTDVDSDNNNSLNDPLRTPQEEGLEDQDGKPGKIFAVNDGDVDGDGIPDFADGYSLFSEPNFDTLANGRFIPYILDLSGVKFLEDARIGIQYNPSNPASVARTGSGTPVDPYVYTPQGSYSLRLWTRNAHERIAPAGSTIVPGNSLHQNGYFVQPWVQYAVADFRDHGAQEIFPGVFRLWIEAVRPVGPLGSMIRVEVDPDGDGDDFGFVLEDAVRVMPIAPTLEYVGWDSVEDQEHLGEDVIYPSDPRPEVSLTINSAILNNDGNLVVTVASLVRDELSELADDPNDRVQSLTISANGRVLEVITDLPAMSTGQAVLPWRPNHFNVSFSRTYILLPPLDPDEPERRHWGGEAVVFRAQSSANGAGYIGWDSAAVVLGWREWEPDTQTEGPGGAPAGSINVGTGDSGNDTIYTPFVERIVHDPGSPAGSFYPFLARVSGMDDSLYDYVELKQNNEVQTLRPFSFGPETQTKHYIVHPDADQRPRIFLVTVNNLTGSLARVKPSDLPLELGAELMFDLRDNNNTIIARATAELVPDHLPPPTGSDPTERGPVTEQILISYFRLLYGNAGLKVLNYYQQAGNQLFVGNVLFDFDIDWIDIGLETVVIEIEKDITPIQAAQYLYAGLRQSLAYRSVRNVIPPGDLENTVQAYELTGSRAFLAAAECAQWYLAGFGIVNEGADWVMTAHELSQGNYQAAIGFLPFISVTMVSLAARKLTVRIGNDAADFYTPIVRAMEEADSLPLAQKVQHLEQAAAANNLTLPLGLRMMLVKGKYLEAPSEYKALRRALLGEFEQQTAGWTAWQKQWAQVHHDLLWSKREWFAAHGLDVNDKIFGRWVVGRVDKHKHREFVLHQDWHRDFNAQWRAFELAEDAEDPYSASEIITRMNALRNDFPSRGSPR